MSTKTFGSIVKLTPQKKRLGNIAAGVLPDEAVNKAQLDQIVTGAITLTTVEAGNGTVALPAFSFASDLDNGMYYIGANNYGFAANGAKVVDIATTGVSITGTLSASTSITATTTVTSTTSTAVGTSLSIGTDVTLAKEVNHNVTVTTTTTAATAGGNLAIASGAGATTGAGGTVSVTAGASGAGATGNGGRASVVGGAALSTNGNGGDVLLTGGALAGTGLAGNVVVGSTLVLKQAAQAAKTTSTTLTAAEVIAGILTVNQGGAAASDLTLPLATAMDTALPQSAANDAIDFYVINTSVVAAEDANILTNTGWTLVGGMDIDSYDATNNNSSAHFRARKTGTGAWTLYRLS